MSKQTVHPSLLRIMAGLTGYTIYGAGTVFLVLLFTPVLMIISFSHALRLFIYEKLFRKALYFLTRVSLPVLQVYRVVEEPDFRDLQRGGAKIFVANHRSRIDGPILLTGLSNTGVIMKSSYAGMPLYSTLVKYMNFISVNPDSVAMLSSAMRRCKDLLSSGFSLLVFPEGTRSRSARLLPFRDLSFRLAMENNAPVVPLIVHTDHPFMAKIPKSTIPPFRMNMVIRALPPMFPENGERPVEFAERVRKRMAEEIRLLDKGTIWERLLSKTKIKEPK